jgi:AbrB family looped-hinge helix DNA binding protein
MATTVITTKGQIVIPSKIRKRMNLKKGTKIYLEEKDNELILKPVTIDYFKKLAGILDTKGKLSKKLLEEREKDKKKEA